MVTVRLSRSCIGIDTYKERGILYMVLLDNVVRGVPPKGSVEVTVAAVWCIGNQKPCFPKRMLNPHQKSAVISVYNQEMFSLKEDIFVLDGGNWLL